MADTTYPESGEGSASRRRNSTELHGGSSRSEAAASPDHKKRLT
jgi:hypothetical protein